MNIITFGTFDLLHIGHTNILSAAKEYGPLIVGVSSDYLTLTKKGILPIESEKQRMVNIRKLPYVKEVFLEESLEKKGEYIQKYDAKIMIMGDDWEGKFNHFECKVIYLPRTPDISSTGLKSKLYPERLSCLQPFLRLHGTYKHPDTPTSEIFPLKQYNYYGHKIYGPNRYDTMNMYYSKKFPMMMFGKIKWTMKVRNQKFKTYFLLDDNSKKCTAYDNKPYKFGCNKNTLACFHGKRRGYVETSTNISLKYCCKHKLISILIYIAKLLEEYKIPYFVYWGTLLGIIRHGGSIPWDSDNDLYILDAFVPQFISLIPKINERYYVSKPSNTFYRVNFSKKNRLHLDIYVAEQIPLALGVIS